MPFVRNIVTGLEHEVPPGHYSLSSALFVVLPEPEPEVAPEPAVKPVAKPRGRPAKK